MKWQGGLSYVSTFFDICVYVYIYFSCPFCSVQGTLIGL